MYVFETRVYKNVSPSALEFQLQLVLLPCCPGNLAEIITMFLGNIASDKNDLISKMHVHWEKE